MIDRRALPIPLSQAARMMRVDYRTARGFALAGVLEHFATGNGYARRYWTSRAAVHALLERIRPKAAA